MENTAWIKSSQRKALAALDGVTAAGMNGFSVLSNVTENMNDQDIVKAIEKGKSYLKSLYPAKCTTESSFRTHSTSFALSDNSDLDLMEQKCSVTDGECTKCVELPSSMDQVQIFAEQEGGEGLLYDVNVAIGNIRAYKQHQIRDAQQKLAKVTVFQNLDEVTGFWLKDYYQKVLPAKYREGQKEYFGKKGMTLHVDILFLKENQELVKKIYFTNVIKVLLIHFAWQPLH